MNPAQGTVLSDRYALTERLATGGMGEVWAATDTVLDRIVAMKILNRALSRQDGFLDRFRAEARCSAALAHVSQPPPPLPDTVPAGIRDVIGAALAKDPADRPVDAPAMALALGMPDASTGAPRTGLP